MATVVADPSALSITSPDTVYGPGAGHLHEIGVMGNPYPYGECTWYCWQYYADTQRIHIDGQLGNGTDWVDSAHRERYAVDQQPGPAKIVCWSAAKYAPFGHVAIVDQVNGDGSFWVLEMNFTYFADERPELAGKIDRRLVQSMDGILGFITPTGVQVSGGAAGTILSAISSPFTTIGDAIRQAGLFIQAEAMTAELKAIAMGQIAVGTALGGGGLALGALTAYGRGRPARGYARVGRDVRRLAPAQPSPIGQRTYTETEHRWLSRRMVRELNERARQTPPRPAPAGRPARPPAPRRAAAPRAADPDAGARRALRTEIQQATAIRRANRPGSKPFFDATIRLNTARNRLNALGKKR